MHYVQRRDGRNLETVDQFETRKEARAMLAEYRVSDRSAEYYLSPRPCRAWKDDTPAPAKARNGGRRAPLDLSPRLPG